LNPRQPCRDQPGCLPNASPIFALTFSALARVSYDEAAALDFAGIRIKRHYKVGGGFNFIFEFIS